MLLVVLIQVNYKFEYYLFYVEYISIYIGELLKEIQNLKNENNHLKGELGKIMTRYNLK